MQPNFHDGDRLIINKLQYTFGSPQRGDVVVLHASAQDDYIKRVVALPGDTLKVEGDGVYVNGERIVEGYIQDEINMASEMKLTYNTLDQEEVTVPEGSVFVLGDNRSNSKDSRSLGAIPISEIVGKASVRFYPFSDFRVGVSN